ncbi:MAG TPA: cation-transporting P-type ATPase, partial [Bacillota bacterium]|nr:cation-transporting P-type ATPase [Bacillota bacterium]
MPNEIDVKRIKGLDEAQVKENREKYGANELPQSKKRSVFTTIFEVVKEPMFLLLVTGGIIYLVLGDLKEALMLLAFVFVVMGITIYQEQKTEKAL